MAESAHFSSALQGAVSVGRYGRRGGRPGVIASEVEAAALATVTARKGKRGAVVEAVRSAVGVELPDAPRRTAGPELVFVWSGPDQWLVQSKMPPGVSIEARLAKPLAELASIVDQSQARSLLRITGPNVRDALAKGLAIDLHPREFKTGDAAVTAISHIGVQLWQIDGRPAYEFAVPRSYALSFWHWLEVSAAEYGLELIRG